MTATSPPTWLPTAAHLAQSGPVRLVRHFGLPDYDALLHYALEQPAAYWRGVAEVCEFIWDTPPTGHVDFTNGREFPRWFPGAHLNWVKSVLAWADRADGASRLAIVDEREDGSVESLDYAALHRRVHAFAAALTQADVRRGDRVGLLMENGVTATVSLLAIAALGAVVVPLFSGFGADAVVARLSAAEAKLLLASPSFQRRGKPVDLQSVVRAAWPQLPTLERVLWHTSDPATVLDPTREAVLGDCLHAADAAFTLPSCTPDDAFMLIYTSGTTGKPKGIVHTHGGFPLKIAHDALVHFDLGPGDVFCWPADMGWIAGSLVLGCALLRGATLVCYSGGPDYPDWSRMTRLIERHRITHFGSAPTLIRGMASHTAETMRGDVSSVKLLVTAGEGIDPEHFGWFQQHFGSGVCPLINYTGGTEASGALLGSVVVRPIVPSGFNSPSPGVAVDVVGADGASFVDTVGELAVREPFVGMTQSFWRDDERYLDTYWRTLPGLWIHGDLALHRHDGQYFMRGRSDDTLKIAGKRLGPAEVEEVVLRLPELSEAAAIGVADAERGERLVVFVVPAPACTASADEIAQRVMTQVDTQLGRPFRPSAVHCVRQLPKTRSSKTMRRVIRNLYSGTPPGDLSSLDNPAALDEIRAAAGALPR
jgi:acetyl-CoA synthetase